MDYYDLECANQETIHEEIKRKLTELNELMDYSETYYSYAFEEELARIELVDNLNNILVENGVPERFKIFAGDIDDGNFLGFNAVPYLHNERMGDFDAKKLTSVTKKALPYLKFIDEVLDNIGMDLTIDNIDINYDHKRNDIENIRFIISNNGSYAFTSLIKLKRTSNGKFKLIYLKNSHNFGYEGVVDMLDNEVPFASFISGDIIKEDDNESHIILKSPNELRHMIFKGAGDLHNMFSDISKKYDKLVSKIIKQ